MSEEQNELIKKALEEVARVVNSIDINDTGWNDSRDSIIALVRKELARQDDKWGVQGHDLTEWLAILMEEVGEASKEIVEAHFALRHGDNTAANILPRLESLIAELVQVSAVSVAMIESIERHKEHWLGTQSTEDVNKDKQ